MKKTFIFKSILMAALVVFISYSGVNATYGSTSQDVKINTVVRLGIFKGDADGNLRLDDKIIRSELITAFVRTLGLEGDMNSAAPDISFKDINSSHWAYSYIKTAVKNKLVAGYPDNTIGPDKYINYAEALTLIIRVLGYEDILSSGNWPDNVISKCSELGITKDFSAKSDKQMTRREIASLIYNALSVSLKK